MPKNGLLMTLSAVLMLTTALSAFATGDPENGSASMGDETQEIEFLWQTVGEEGERNWNDYFLQPYMDAHPNVQITLNTVANIRETARVRMSAGEGPDIFGLDAFDIKAFKDADRLLSLQPYSDEYGWEDIFFDWAYRAASVDGELYAIPYAAEVTLMWYNATLMDQYGWQVPETRAEFEALAEAAVAEGLIPIGYGFSGLPLLNQWLYDHYFNAYAGADKMIAVLKGEVPWTDRDMVGAIELMKADWDQGWWNEKQSNAITIDEGRALFFNGRALLNPEGTWLANTDFGTDYEFDAVPWPSMRDGVEPSSSVATGAVMVVNKNTEHPDTVAGLLNFLYTELETVANGIAYGGIEPLTREVDPSFYPEDTAKYVLKGFEVMNGVMANVDNLGYAPWGFYPNKTNQYLMDNLDQVFFDRLSVEDYMAEAQEKFEEDVADGYVFAGE